MSRGSRRRGASLRRRGRLAWEGGGKCVTEAHSQELPQGPKRLRARAMKPMRVQMPWSVGMSGKSRQLHLASRGACSWASLLEREKMDSAPAHACMHSCADKHPPTPTLMRTCKHTHTHARTHKHTPGSLAQILPEKGQRCQRNPDTAHECIAHPVKG